MKIFTDKNPLLGIGIMTGTSCDGIDISAVKFTENSDDFMELIAFNTLPLPKEITGFVQKCSQNQVQLSDISQFNFFLSQIFANAVKEFLSFNNLKESEIDFIAVHGQTIWHNPAKTLFFGNEVASTFQSINLSALSKLTEIPVIGDFRAGDIAFGGQGAPLVPIFDKRFFQSKVENTICLNIGGISNLTFIPKENSHLDFNAFDCGPGNTLINIAAKKYYGLDYDIDGETASKGKLIRPLFDELLRDDYLMKTPPKSTGREKYNLEYLNKSLDKLVITPEPTDILRTFTELTAEAISININQFTDEDSRIIVSGGGRNNLFLMNLLKEKLPKSKFIDIEDFGIPSDGKESIAFAYLGWLFLKGLPGNIPSATGARKETILGTLAI